jgi:glycosyltransferase involved in cell wall biosynthesis
MNYVANSTAIIIPCFNAERTLAATIESALREDVAEIVVIDDGSTDGSLAIARRFEPRVRVLTGLNRGVSAARNRGIAETTSDWLVFLDSDDLLNAGTMPRRLACATETGADVIICDWEDMVDDGNGAVSPSAVRMIDWTAISEDAEQATATIAWATTAAILYRRKVVDLIGGFRPDLPVIQDARYLFDAVRVGGRLAHCPHVGARYRVSADSLSRRSSVRFWEDVLLNGQQIETYWREAGAFNNRRRQAVQGIYNTAARGLFAAAHPSYFDAIQALRDLGLPEMRHGRIAVPLARAVGLRTARNMLALVGRV